jgi:L-histidine Nalpha-methyltransferase
MDDVVVEVFHTAQDAEKALRRDARTGLTSSPKWLPPKWFYDVRGSQLFEDITRLEDYYPTRAEREILDRHAPDIATLTGAHTLVELGSGSSEKTRLLLDALRSGGTLHQFVPLDVSESALREAVAAIARDYPGTSIHGVVGDFTEHLARTPGEAPRLVAFLGGTIGNLFPGERASFLAEVREVLSPGEWLLLGTDLVKDPAVLVRAYDDRQGVTADFNRNVLSVLNRELGADFLLEDFDHRALWDARHEWVEMRLRARRPLTVMVDDLDLHVRLEQGEEIRTEISAKFRREGVEAELTTAGFEMAQWWTDDQRRFALSLAHAV